MTERVVEGLKRTVVPSIIAYKAVAEMHAATDGDYTLGDEVRTAIAADAPRVLRVLLAERLAELADGEGEIDGTRVVELDAVDSSAWLNTAGLLSLLAPEVPE